MLKSTRSITSCSMFQATPARLKVSRTVSCDVSAQLKAGDLVRELAAGARPSRGRKTAGRR